MMLKKNRLFCLVLIVLTFAFTVAGPAGAAPKRIGVVSFENASQVRDSAFGGGMADIMVSELMQNKNYEVIERAQLDKVLREQYHGATGMIDDSTAAEMGKILGLNYVVTGKIIEAGVTQSNIIIGRQTTIKVLVSVKMVDVQTGKVVFADTAEGRKSSTQIGNVSSANLSSAVFSEAARQAIAKAAFQINELNPLEGVVLQVKADSLMIDIGRDSGVKAGQKYVVIREGAPIYHPRTGALVGVDQTEVATFTITRVDANTAIGGKIKENDGLQVKTGDIVRRSE